MNILETISLIGWLGFFGIGLIAFFFGIDFGIDYYSFFIASLIFGIFWALSPAMQRGIS